jgi:Tetratricopeptide repeat/Protein kinase domain
MTDYIGQQLGNYRLIRLLGEGSFAEVYLGEHIHLGTLAAIKVLHTQLTSDDIDRFRNEARIISRLIHPHIVRVLEEDLALFREMSDQCGIAYALNALGLVSLIEVNVETARLLQEESLEICRALGDRLGITYTLCALGWLELLQGNYAVARTMYEQSLALAIVSGNKCSRLFVLRG